jgi:hypothetical protein
MDNPKKQFFKWLVFAFHITVLGGKLDGNQFIKIRK